MKFGEVVKESKLRNVINKINIIKGNQLRE